MVKVYAAISLKTLFLAIAYLLKSKINRMKSGYMTLLGFVFLVLGFLSILFSLIGLQFSFFKFITNLGPGLALLIQLIMLFGGIILMYISRMPPEEE